MKNIEFYEGVDTNINYQIADNMKFLMVQELIIAEFPILEGAYDGRYIFLEHSETGKRDDVMYDEYYSQDFDVILLVNFETHEFNLEIYFCADGYFGDNKTLIVETNDNKHIEALLKLLIRAKCDANYINIL